ncbi:LysR family transcriptional regulator [Herbaspirillum sp. NPDC087042]|uniref:LysR family transcriptional regulator n=1 Tax=Herbaspirillum sp. NPDC087042 TaxID=3364004 RepID=UPI00380AC0E2
MLSPATTASRKTGAADRIMLLQTFLRIVESGGMSAAAVALGVTQPTVSRRLRQLEDYFGTPLLERSPPPLCLTEEGQECYRYAATFLPQWEAAFSGKVATPERR